MTSGGIYKIENTVNNKVYIGQTQNFKNRWQKHISALSNNRHRNEHLQSAWNKYGEEAFAFSIVERCSGNIDKQEIYWIAKYNATDRRFGYNVALGGSVPMLGRHHSEETKRKISEAHQGMPNSMKGKTYGEETRKKMSASAILRCEKCKPKGMLGMHHTEEAKQKISKMFISRKTSRNTSGYIGVHFDKTRNKWLVMINVNGKSKNIGRYEDLIYAAEVYDKACWELHHDLSLLNFPEEYSNSK